MKKRDLASRISMTLRERGIGKVVRMRPAVFHISDDEGNQKDFVVRQTEKKVFFNTKDIEPMVDAMIDIIAETIQSGEDVTFKGFGKFTLGYRKPSRYRDMKTGELDVFEGYYFPKFVAGKYLKYRALNYNNTPVDILNRSIQEDDTSSDEYDIDE